MKIYQSKLQKDVKPKYTVLITVTAVTNNIGGNTQGIYFI